MTDKKKRMKFTCFAGQKVFLFGLGASGLATARALAEGGAQLTVWDDRPQAVAAAQAAGLAAADLRQAEWGGVKALILSPGVPLTHPQPHWSAALARQHKAEIIGDIELFCRERKKFLADRNDKNACPLIAITGTNGKSTTTALTAHLLEQAGREVEMGGNIGRPVAELAEFAPGRIYVLELSSYQIDLTPSLHPTVGILLNITPDHIDRHGSFANYAAVKERLVAAAETAIIGADDAPCRAIYQHLQATGKKVIYIPAESSEIIDSSAPFPETKLLTRKTIVYLERKGERLATDVFDFYTHPVLHGYHNIQDAACAIKACDILGVDPFKIKDGLETYKGLPHRMEDVGRLKLKQGEIWFINDSKATNAEATAPALQSFNNIYWIAGGRPKEGGIESLKGDLSFIKKVYLIGEAQEEFAKTLKTIPTAAIAIQSEERRQRGDEHSEFLEVKECGTLAAAVKQAVKDAIYDLAKDYLEPPRVTILLSPACASFDQFNNFEERGAAFAALAREECEKAAAEKA